MGVVTKRNNNSKQLNTNKSVVAFFKLNRSLKTSVRRYTQIPVSIPVAPVKTYSSVQSPKSKKSVELRCKILETRWVATAYHIQRTNGQRMNSINTAQFKNLTRLPESNINTVIFQTVTEALVTLF